MDNSKLENIEAIAFLTLISINGMVLSTSQAIIRTCSSASLITSFIVSLLAIVVVLILSLFAKNFSGKSILDISDFLGGKILKFSVGIIFIVYFTFRASLFLKKICDCLQTIYYPMTNIIFISLLFCIATGIVIFLGNNCIFKTAVLVLPLMLASVVLIFVGNGKNFDFTNIFPILGNGITSTFLSGLSNIYAFYGLAYLLFVPQKLKHPENFRKICLIAIILSSCFLLFSCGNILFLFGEKFSNSEFFPLYISVRSIEFGTFFQRLDSMFLLFCVLGFIPIFSINTYIVIDIFKNITNISNEKPIIFAYLLSIFGITMCYKLNSTILFLETTISKSLLLIIGILLPFLILIFANIKKKFMKKAI